MNKIAEIMYGKVVNIYERSRTLEEMRALFAPAALLVDVTNIEDVGVGYAVDYGSGLETPNFIPPPKILPQTLEEAKAAKHTEAGVVFAQKRDAIRQIQLSDGNTYGFDCSNEDITNFLASWKAAEESGNTPYKVWCADGNKGMITMQLSDFGTVFNAVRTSQLEAYAWYGTIDAQIQACETKEELDAIALT